jgi:3-isopropylmalate/(R)-2-methylmalate dehydratase small subunit
MNWIYRGKCWKFGDNIHIDGEIMPLHFVRERETRAEILAQHVMEGLDPEFHIKVSPQDIIVAGKRFGAGNPHAQGFRGIQKLGLGIVAEWITRGAYRNCILTGIPVIPVCPNILAHVSTGDSLDVDFETGSIFNQTTSVRIQGEPVPRELLDIIAAGGSVKYIEKQLAAR